MDWNQILVLIYKNLYYAYVVLINYVLISEKWLKKNTFLEQYFMCD